MPDIAIWNRCNSHCVMCTNPKDYQEEENSSQYTFESLKKRWLNRDIDPDDDLSLTGGEPTIHPDFFNILKWFRNNYPQNRIVIASNGRMFSYENFTKRCLQMNDMGIEIAIHGWDAKSHDAITRTPGSFKQTVKGIHNIIKYKNESQYLEIRIVITKLTYQHLDKILSFIQNEFSLNDIRDIVLIFMEMEGQAQDNFKIVGVTYTQVKKYLPEVVRKWSKEIKDLRIYHFPLCTIPVDLWKYAWRTQRPEEITYLPQCNKCPYKKYCLGVHKDYLRLIGGQEFKPIKKKIFIRESKSFYHPIISAKEEK